MLRNAIATAFVTIGVATTLMIGSVVPARADNDRANGTITGAIIGGALGALATHGSSRGAIIGAVAGAVIGNAASGDDDYRYHRYYHRDYGDNYGYRNYGGDRDDRSWGGDRGFRGDRDRDDHHDWR